MSKITPGSNTMWEASRIIVPELRSAFQQYHRDKLKRTKPILDEQQIEEFSYIINESLNEKKMVKVFTFGEFGDSEHKGIITAINMNSRKIELEIDEDIEWIKFDDIVDIFFM